MKKKIILIGGFSEVIELCESEKIQIVGIIDNRKTGNYLGYQIFGNDNCASELFNTYSDVPVFITPDDPHKRDRLRELYQNIGFDFTNIISSGSVISKSAEFGKGIFIQNAVNISSSVKIGSFVRVNTMANIMHDTIIGNYTTVAPNAVLLGDVKIGNHCYIGSNSTILPHTNIGDDVIIGAGAVVTRDVPNNKTVVGNPARELIKEYKAIKHCTDDNIS